MSIVRASIPSQDIQIGDVLLDTHGIVVEVEVGERWTTLTVANPRWSNTTRSIARGVEVPVRREA